MKISEMIRMLQLARQDNGDVQLATYFPGESPRVVDNADLSPTAVNGVRYVLLTLATSSLQHKRESEGSMDTIFGRVEPLPDRDPTAPLDEPPLMAGG